MEPEDQIDDAEEDDEDDDLVGPVTYPAIVAAIQILKAVRIRAAAGDTLMDAYKWSLVMQPLPVVQHGMQMAFAFLAALEEHPQDEVPVRVAAVVDKVCEIRETIEGMLRDRGEEGEERLQEELESLPFVEVPWEMNAEGEDPRRN